jgi:hypothetical protein
MASCAGLVGKFCAVGVCVSVVLTWIPGASVVKAQQVAAADRPSVRLSPQEASVSEHKLGPEPTQHYPGFPVRSSRQVCVCGFLYGKPHEPP